MQPRRVTQVIRETSVENLDKYRFIYQHKRKRLTKKEMKTKHTTYLTIKNTYLD